MKRIREYFEKATTCRLSSERLIGMEIETLAVSKKDRQPISLAASSQIMEGMISGFGWQIQEERGGRIVRLEKDGSVLTYDLGWNNFELITPPYAMDDERLFGYSRRRLEELAASAERSGAILLSQGFDGSRSNTLILPDQRDEIWLELDGPALYGVGHIACVHFNVDLCSVDEGMEMMRRLRQLYQTDRGWPAAANQAVWRQYICDSLAGYEASRYGPPPTDFDEYCQTLAGYKLVMNKVDGQLEIVRPARSFRECQLVDLDLFVRSVWWWSRLRVRRGKLVLEVRDVPRHIPVVASLATIRKSLGL